MPIKIRMRSVQDFTAEEIEDILTTLHADVKELFDENHLDNISREDRIQSLAKLGLYVYFIFTELEVPLASQIA